MKPELKVFIFFVILGGLFASIIYFTDFSFSDSNEEEFESVNAFIINSDSNTGLRLDSKYYYFNEGQFAGEGETNKENPISIELYSQKNYTFYGYSKDYYVSEYKIETNESKAYRVDLQSKKVGNLRVKNAYFQDGKFNLVLFKEGDVQDLGICFYWSAEILKFTPRDLIKNNIDKKGYLRCYDVEEFESEKTIIVDLFYLGNLDKKENVKFIIFNEIPNNLKDKIGDEYGISKIEDQVFVI